MISEKKTNVSWEASWSAVRDLQKFNKQERNEIELWKKGRVTRDRDGTLPAVIHENGQLVDEEV